MKFGNIEELSDGISVPVGIGSAGDNYEVILNVNDHGRSYTKRMSIRDFAQLVGVAGDYIVHVGDSADQQFYGGHVLTATRYITNYNNISGKYTIDKDLYTTINTANPLYGIDGQGTDHKFYPIIYDISNGRLVYYDDDQHELTPVPNDLIAGTSEPAASSESE